MLRAAAVTFEGRTTGIYLPRMLFPRLGIAGEMAAKSTTAAVAAVAKGEAELAIQPVSELLHVAGTEFVGPLPKDIQYISGFAAAVVAGTKELKKSQRLIAFLNSDSAAAAIKKAGMEPVKSR